MLTSEVYKYDGDYGCHYIAAGMNDETLAEAKRIFETYRKNGVILNKEFFQNEWIITNQLHKYILRFDVNEFTYKRYAEKWLGSSSTFFVECAKVYISFLFGKVSPERLQAVTKVLTNIAGNQIKSVKADFHIIEFLKLLPANEVKDQKIDQLEEELLFLNRKSKNTNQRILAEFDVYFRFNDAIEEFWTKANDKERLFYFPIYFWWRLTAILPLRPIEFLLIPRNCIEKKNGEYILTIRRNNLKGRKAKVYYNINGDYKLMKYVIPNNLAQELEKYIAATNGMELSKLETLFVQEPHFAYLNRKCSFSSYYSYQSLSFCLAKFQIEIMKIDDEGRKIKLGDTRHLAMISLIASGGSPVICKELAGHNDINISSHYYANISKFVECATYEMYRKRKSGHVEMARHKLYTSRETVKVNGGRCDSNSYINGSIDDCIRNVGSDGELGNCMFCPHFIDGKSGEYLIFSDAEEKRKQVDADSRYLMYVLETVRKGKGCNEDIQSALLKLQHSSSLYSQCLYRNMEV